MYDRHVWCADVCSGQSHGNTVSLCSSSTCPVARPGVHCDTNGKVVACMPHCSTVAIALRVCYTALMDPWPSHACGILCQRNCTCLLESAWKHDHLLLKLSVLHLSGLLIMSSWLINRFFFTRPRCSECLSIVKVLRTADICVEWHCDVALMLPAQVFHVPAHFCPPVGFQCHWSGITLMSTA